MLLTKVFLPVLFVALAISAMGQTTGERKEKIQEREAAPPSKEALDRKARSNARLQKESVPTLDLLPVIEDSTDAKKRTKEEIARRAVAICITALKGEGLDQFSVDSFVKKFGAEAFFSPDEAAFIKNANPSEKDRNKFTWRYESLVVLLWSLGYIDHLDRPDKICDVVRTVSFLRERDMTQFVNEAKLRPLSEILDEADLIYRYHWATTEARIKGKEAPAKLDGDVIQERHYVLNWLIGYMDQAWDDISTDT